MVKPVILTASFAVALALAAPSIAHGQAIPKTSGGSSGSTTTTGSANPGSSSSGGGGGSSVSGGSGSGVSQPPSAPPRSSSSSSSGSDLNSFSRSIKGGSVSSPTKSESVQKAPIPGGVAAVIEGQVNSSSSSSLTRTRMGLRGITDSGTVGSGGRERDNYPLQGYATPRVDGAGNGDLISFPFYGPWGSWYPWFAGGFGWYAGYYGYNPWYYAATCWSWNAWGPWFDPYGYCWNPYSGGGYTMYSSGSDDDRGPKAAATTGTLRIKANLPTAKIYIDKAFAGTVEEFNGLGNHLELDGGRHAVELRADGYKTISKEIEVKIGKTQTVRLSLKKE